MPISDLYFNKLLSNYNTTACKHHYSMIELKSNWWITILHFLNMVIMPSVGGSLRAMINYFNLRNKCVLFLCPVFSSKQATAKKKLSSKFWWCYWEGKLVCSQNLYFKRMLNMWNQNNIAAAEAAKASCILVRSSIQTAQNQNTWLSGNIFSLD